jgi:ribosomal protein S18 acetylase RimI-like enzyme
MSRSLRRKKLRRPAADHERPSKPHLTKFSAPDVAKLGRGFSFMNVIITAARPDHIPEIIRLMREFAEYEKLLQFCEVTEERLRDAMFGPGAFVKGLIAAKDQKLIGYALAYRSFASFRGQRGYFLEDLYVSGDARGTGIGEALIRAVARMARADGAERLDLLVLKWNEPARRFYKRLGGREGDDEAHYRFLENAFDGLASET